MVIILRHISTGGVMEVGSFLEAASILRCPITAFLAGKSFEFNGWKATRFDDIEMKTNNKERVSA